MNVKLLRKVAKHIAEEPRRFVMGSAIALGAETVDAVRDWKDRKYIHFKVAPPCGTAACIAGWTCLLSGHKPKDFEMSFGGGYRFWGEEGISAEATKLLNISSRRADELFHVHNWKAAFRRQFLKAKTAKGRTAAALRQIDHFIATKGKE